ncbi:hypothetical protein ACEN2P_08100 [Pedobacter psychrotolerans]|uniref:hypothetical protein n=1 Tax=Pedobacter psychrotolerans TaxID=1843235 RepID=UPI003F98C2B9
MAKLKTVAFSLVTLIGIFFGINHIMAGEKESLAKRANLWFSVNISSAPQTNPANQAIQDTGHADPNCETGSDICEVQLDVTALPPGYNYSGKTVQDVLNDGASYTGSGETPEYTFRD